MNQAFGCRLSGWLRGSMLAGAAAIMFLSGCTSVRQACAVRLGFRRPAPLLDDRGGVVPPAFDQPASGATGSAASGLGMPGAYIPSEAATEVELPPFDVELVLDEEDPEGDDAPETGTFTTIELPPVVETEVLTYSIKKGDTLWDIARMYGVSHQELAAHNDVGNANKLSVGKVLRIPPGGKFIEPADRPPMVATATTTVVVEALPLPSDRKYTVVQGDNLWTIARRFGVKSADIRALNKLTSDVIQPGDVLVIPKADGAGAAQPPHSIETLINLPPGDDTGPPGTVEDDGTAVEPPPPEPAVLPNLLDHTVTDGDTLGSIAEMYGTSTEEIKKANPSIKSDEDLVPNLKIVVPFE